MIQVRHRRPGCQWHSNQLNIEEKRFSTRRRIRLTLDGGDVAIELSPEHATELINQIADILEGN